jgi:osmotically-inducible protein OsmY
VRNFHKLAMIVVLGSGFAIAQSMPQQPGSSQSPTSSQSPSTTTDQSKPLPNTDQNSTTGSQPSSTDQKDQTGQGTTDKSGQSLPQSDASPSASANANGDVQNTIQSAIQKDPTLSTANITVDVKNGKMVTLNGTVPSKDAKDAAERIAKENSGGLKVKNHLKVASNNTDQNANPKGGDMSNPKH